MTHDEGPAKIIEMFRKALKSLKPNGRLAVHDFMLNDDRTGPLYDTLLCLHMLGFIVDARVYTVREYADWLAEAGFNKVEKYIVGGRNGCPETKVLIASASRA